MKRFLLAVAAIVAIAAGGLAVVGGSAGAQSPSDARVRVVHASPDAPGVDVYANDNKVLTNVEFPAASDYLTVPAGTYNFKVFATGADPVSDEPVIDADATLAAGKDYTVAAVGLVADIQPAVFEDNNAAPAEGKAHVRVIHASPDAPAVDIAVAGGPVVIAGLAFPDASEYTPVDEGTYDLEVRAAGTETVALPLDGVSLAAAKIYTVIAVGLLEGEPALDVLVIADDPRAAAPAPGTIAGCLAGSAADGPNGPTAQLGLRRHRQRRWEPLADRLAGAGGSGGRRRRREPGVPSHEVARTKDHSRRRRAQFAPASLLALRTAGRIRERSQNRRLVSGAIIFWVSSGSSWLKRYFSRSVADALGRVWT